MAVRGRSQGRDARMGSSNDRGRLHCGRSCFGGQGSVIRRLSCPCFRCCRDGPLRAQAGERELPRARNAERSSIARATSALPGRQKQAMPAAGHCPRGAKRVGEKRAAAWLAYAHVPVAAGAMASAMAAESRGKPKIKGAAWCRPRGTGSAAGGEKGTALGSPAPLLHSLLAAASGSPRSLHHWHSSTRKPVSKGGGRHSLCGAHGLCAE